MVSGGHAPPQASDPRSQLFDITTKLGRGKEQKEQRKRKKEGQEYLPLKKMDSLGQTRKHSPNVASIPTDLQSGDDMDEKFLSNLDQNSLAAKALNIAQATLRGENANQASHKAKPAANARMGQHDAAARVCKFWLTFQLLARHSAPPDSLPRANLRGSKLHSNGSDPMHKESQKSKLPSNSNDDADDDLIIVR